MVVFHSFADKWQRFLSGIIYDHALHARWLNTLSYLENCGARKIAKCEHPTMVREQMLKHAAEEFRHAYYLKRQLSKLTTHPPVDYHPSTMLGGIPALQYLRRLDVSVSRYLKAYGISGHDLIAHAYILVTYAIELRAREVYPLYHQILQDHRSPVAVKSILLEEEEHLREMEEELHKIPQHQIHCNALFTIEGEACHSLLQALNNI